MHLSYPTPCCSPEPHYVALTGLILTIQSMTALNSEIHVPLVSEY